MNSRIISDKSQLKKFINRYGIRAPPSFLLTNLEIISNSVVALARALNFDVVAIGHDSTKEALKIAKAFLNDFTKFGLSVHYLNELSAPEISFATQDSDILGIYFTGSHEAPDNCGIKLFSRGSQLVGTNLTPLIRLLDSSKSVRFQPVDYSRMLKKIVTSGVCNLTVRKIAVANSTSAGGKVLCRCLSALGHSILELGPLHQTVPKPWEERYASLWTKSQLSRLTLAVKNGEADLGLVIDEDGDRVVLVIPEYGLVPCDEMGAVITQIWKAPNEKLQRIVCDYRTSPRTLDFLQNREKEVILCEVGRDAIVNCMLSTGSSFGFEMSGHFFFKEFTAVRADAILAAAILVSSNELERVYSSVREMSHFRWRAGEFRIKTQAINAQKLAMESTMAIRNGIDAKLSYYNSGIICIIPQRTYLVVRCSHTGRELSIMIWATDLECLNKILGAMKSLVQMEQ